MESFDGKKQRNALTGAEQALRALAAGRPDRARQSAAKAADLDQIGLYGGLAAAVEAGAARLDDGDPISSEDWDRLLEAVGPGPLQALIEELRQA